MAIQTITMDQLDRLGVDPDNGHLYWDGRKVVTALSFPWWGQTAIIITAISTALMAISMVSPQIANLF